MSQRIRKRRAGGDRDFMLLAFGLTCSLTLLVGLVMVEVWKRC